MTLQHFFALMEHLHFVFGLPAQYQTLEQTIQGEII
jgi:hypothetical protein